MSNTSYKVKIWDGKEFFTDDLENAKKLVKEELDSWMNPGDYVSFANQTNRIHAAVIDSDSDEITDASAIIYFLNVA